MTFQRFKVILSENIGVIFPRQVRGQLLILKITEWDRFIGDGESNDINSLGRLARVPWTTGKCFDLGQPYIEPFSGQSNSTTCHTSTKAHGHYQTHKWQIHTTFASHWLQAHNSWISITDNHSNLDQSTCQYRSVATGTPNQDFQVTWLKLCESNVFQVPQIFFSDNESCSGSIKVFESSESKIWHVLFR